LRSPTDTNNRAAQWILDAAPLLAAA